MPTNPPVNVTIRCQYSEMVAVDSLKPHPKNPREHGKKQVRAFAEALVRNGFRRAIIASKLSGIIIAGHGTLQAAKEWG